MLLGITECTGVRAGLVDRVLSIAHVRDSRALGFVVIRLIYHSVLLALMGCCEALACAGCLLADSEAADEGLVGDFGVVDLEGPHVDEV